MSNAVSRHERQAGEPRVGSRRSAGAEAGGKELGGLDLELIHYAREAGEFDDLEGAGKRLPYLGSRILMTRTGG